MVTVIPVHLALTGQIDADLNRVAVTLAQIEHGMDPALERDLLEAAQFMRTMAKAYVRVDTGSLSKSIRVEHIRQLAVRVRAGGYVVNPKTGTLVNYAVYVEAKYPFMRPAWEHARNFVTARVTDSLTALAETSIR